MGGVFEAPDGRAWAACETNGGDCPNWPCGVMVARLTTNQEVVVSSTTSVIVFVAL